MGIKKDNTQVKMHYFTDKNIGRIYAKGRPYLHDQVIQQARVFMNLRRPVRQALDIACGTGLSTVALRNMAQHIVALDISYYMVASAPRDRQTSYIVAAAEHIPIAAANFNVVTVSSAFHWFDKKRFVKELNRVLKPNGWVIIYETHFAAKLENCPEFGKWFWDVYVKRYPAPPRDFTINFDDFENAGILFCGEESYESTVCFTSEQFVNYQLSMTSVISAVESGRDTYEGAARWVRRELKQFPVLCPAGKASGKFIFAGLIQYFQKQK